MKEHYFIVKYSKDKGWEFDPEVEDDKFQAGTIWNCNTKEWETPYEGDGNFNDNNDLVTEKLQEIIQQANEREGESK